MWRVVLKLEPGTSLRLGSDGRFGAPDEVRAEQINALLSASPAVARVYPLFGEVAGDSPEERELKRFVAVDLAEPRAGERLAAELKALDGIEDAYLEAPAAPA